jgi:hypothetical protein
MLPSRFEYLGVPINQEAAHRKIVFVGNDRDLGDRQTPGVGD